MHPDYPPIEKISYSIREAVRATSISRTSLYAHISAGRLRTVRIGGRVVIPADSLRALVSGSEQ